MNVGVLIAKQITSFQINVLKHILDASRFHIKLAVIDDRPIDTISRKLSRNVKKKRGGYILLKAAQHFHSKETSWPSEEFFRKQNIDIFKTNNIYSPDSISTIDSYFLDVLVLLSGFGVVKKPLLHNCPQGILMYHHGNLRKYRGGPPAFWELFNGRSDMGLTVQKITERWDCGIPIVEKTIEIKINDDLPALQERVYSASEEMMLQALKNISVKKFKPGIIHHYGKIYTLPNFNQWLRLNYRVSKRKIISKIKPSYYKR